MHAATPGDRQTDQSFSIDHIPSTTHTENSTTADILSGRMRATGALSIMSTVYTSTYLTANYTAAACKARARSAERVCVCAPGLTWSV